MVRKRVSKGSVSYLKKQCDKEFSLLIREHGRCEKCGKSEGLQCAHIIGRRNMMLRWDPMNALCFCVGCHLYWQHKEPLQFTDWFRERHEERYNYLMMKKNKIIKRSKYDYEVLLNNLKRREV